jgi:cell division protein FtsB
MSETQSYKTATFKRRTAFTVESALIAYIMSTAKMVGPELAASNEILNAEIERAEEALVALRAGAMSTGA